ncbi:MAG: hypothetical protein NTV82_00715 [Candidatus Aminicenantes bacterium]|nr:hypothetical protein [Candidatus Aminicenantes bacterium]
MFWKVVVVVALILVAAWLYGHRWQYVAAGGTITKINRFTGDLYAFNGEEWERK